MTSVCRVRPPTKRSRAAFTLVELMVVLAIIGVLVALVAAAVTKVIPAQQQRNTERTIQKLNGELQAHWRAVIDDAKEEAKRFGSSLPTMNLAGGDPERAKVLWIKLRLAQQFPMSYWELVNPGQAVVKLASPNPPLHVGQTKVNGQILPSFISGDTSYMKKLQAAGINPSALLPPADAPIPGIDPNAPTAPVAALLPASMDELSACLYIALTAKGHRGRTTQEDSFNPDERGTAATGLPMFVDGWGKPIVFVRWPADPSAPDPLDSTRRLLDPTWNNAANTLSIPGAGTVPLMPLLETVIKHPLHAGTGPGNWSQVDFFLSPVIVSAGLDGELGVNYYLSPDGSGKDSDNIYSHLLK